MRSKRLREAALATNTDPEQKKDQYLGWGALRVSLNTVWVCIGQAAVQKI